MSKETTKQKKQKRKATAYELECAARLQKIADQRNVGQEVLAEALGISQGAISHYYTGENPLNVKRLIDFSRVLGCMPNEIDTERKIFNLFSDEELKILSLAHSAPDWKRKAGLAYLKGLIDAE